MTLRICIIFDNAWRMTVGSGKSGSGSANARSFFIIFFVLALAFSLIFAGIFKANTSISIDAYAKKSKSSSSGGGGNRIITRTSQTQATNGFLAYEDPASLFSIQYPSNWEILAPKEGDVTFTTPDDFESGRQPSTVIVIVTDTNATTLDQLTSEDKFGLEHNPLVQSKIIDESQATLSGLPAHKIVTDSGLSTSVQFTAVDIFTLKNGKEYKVSYNLGQQDDLPIIQQMIDSFQITK